MKQSAPVFKLSPAGRAARDALTPAKRAKWTPSAPVHGHWVHVYRDEHLRRKRVGCQQCRTSLEAAAHNFELQAKEAAYREGREKRPVRSGATWTDWSVHIKEKVAPKMASPGPLLSQLARMDRAWALMPLAAITAEDCEKLLADAEAGGLAASSVRALYGRAKAVFARAVKAKWLQHNPWNDVDAPSVDAEDPIVLTHAQVERLLLAAGEWRLLLLTAVLCGLRRGELGGLLWENVSEESGGVIRVCRSWGRKTTKSGRERLVPVHPSLAPVLFEAKKAATSRYVFPGPTGKMRSSHWRTAELIRRIADTAGVHMPEDRVLTFHALRRCFATFIGEMSRDGVALQELMGHSSLDVTSKAYLRKKNLPQLAAAIAAVPGFASHQSATPQPLPSEDTPTEAQKVA